MPLAVQEGGCRLGRLEQKDLPLNLDNGSSDAPQYGLVGQKMAQCRPTLLSFPTKHTKSDN
jgi:hypothetical protein